MRPDLITFDCYGTLIDWNLGIGRAFQEEARRQGVAINPEAVLEAYHQAEPEAEDGDFRSYREVLAETATAVAARMGWNLPAGRRGFLAASLPDWPPFPDTNPALERLAGAGYRLGILSNVDNDLLAASLRHLTVEFDLLVTAQRVRSYKPAEAHFRRALQEVGEETDRLLHVAQSIFHDVRPAARLGIRTVWVNRGEEAPPEEGSSAVVEVRDLGEAADWILERH